LKFKDKARVDYQPTAISSGVGVNYCGQCLLRLGGDAAESGWIRIPSLKYTSIDTRTFLAFVTWQRHMNHNTHHVMHDEFITKAQLAARMKVTTRTIDSWMAKGYVPFRKIGRTVRFSWAEVCERLLARNLTKLNPSTKSTMELGIASILRQEARAIRKKLSPMS
jgi:excisionase family DNA binding protein